MHKKIYVNEALTDLRQAMCYYARNCDKVKTVTSNNGKIICYLKSLKPDGKNVTKVLEGPEDLAELLGEPLITVLKKLRLAPQ